MHQKVDDWKIILLLACHLFKCKFASFREGIRYTFFLREMWLSNIWFVFSRFHFLTFSFYEHGGIMAPLLVVFALNAALRCVRWVWLEVLVFCLIVLLTEHPKPFCHFRKTLGAERKCMILLPKIPIQPAEKLDFAVKRNFAVQLEVNKMRNWNWGPLIQFQINGMESKQFHL